jgi:tellurite resistance protein TerC
MNVAALEWSALLATLLVLVVIDLFVLHRGNHIVTMRAAASASIGWTALGLGFAGVIAWLDGGESAHHYVTAFLLEKTLSLDNVAVFAVLFTAFAIPQTLRSRLLSWGVLAALVLRIMFIAAGLALVSAAHAVLYVFGALLIFTGVRMLLHRTGDADAQPPSGRALRVVGRVLPLTTSYDGARYVTRDPAGRTRRRVGTPLLSALIAIAAADVVFAVDSIPATFAITTEPFLVVAANAFAVLGLRPLYFLLAGALDRFVHLSISLAAVLVFIGAKMLLADVVHVPVGATLAVVAVLLAAGVATSWFADRSARPSSGDTVRHQQPAEIGQQVTER